MSEADLNELYQEIILDHYKHPRHTLPLPDGEADVDEENPTCGDRIKLRAALKDGRVESIRYEATGCAISVASASMMAEMLTGRSVEEAMRDIRDFVACMKGDATIDPDRFGDAVALEGVKRYPLRIKCATMGWHAAQHAFEKHGSE